MNPMKQNTVICIKKLVLDADKIILIYKGYVGLALYVTFRNIMWNEP